MQITCTEVGPDRIQPWHEDHDSAKTDQLVESMTANGWTGPPVVAIYNDGDPIAITGSHRIPAARRTETDIPVVDLDELLRAHGTTLADVDEQTGSDPSDPLHYETVVRLNYFLPAEVIEYYGLDAH